MGVTQCRSWLRHSATSLKVMGSIPDGVIGVFHLRNPSGRTMVLGSTQSLSEMRTSNISWGLKAARADNLNTFMCRMSLKSGSPNLLELSGSVKACNGIALPFIYFIYYIIYVVYIHERKILSIPSFGREVKPFAPCRRFSACKRSLNGVKNRSFRQNYRTIFAHSSTFRY
jgi:hypothetical protein